MKPEGLVHLALHELSCNQKDLAKKLGVSPTQISKWKKGEHMSRDMEEKLRELANIGIQDPDFLKWAGSLEAAAKWENLIRFLGKLAHEENESGYNAELFDDVDSELCWQISYILNKLGVPSPKDFPNELNFDYDTEESDETWRFFEDNPYCKLIQRILTSYANIYGFYAAFVSDLIFDDELDLLDTPACNIEPELLSLAATKIEIPEEFKVDINKFIHQTQKDFSKWLTIVKEKAIRASVPLKAEILDLAYASYDSLGADAEAEALGFNSTRLHPDIYMNELLVGMRTIHQVLPFILKKLDLEEDFRLDTSALRISR
jgi:transcriptional regulator with XRE-family HTH domain